MSPKAYSRRKERRGGNGMRRSRDVDENKADLGNSIEWAANVEDTLRIARDAFGDHDPSTTFLTNLVDVGTTFANDDGRILGDDEASHVNVGRRGGGARRRGGIRRGGGIEV
jgi:hypothetical protein